MKRTLIKCKIASCKVKQVPFNEVLEHRKTCWIAEIPCIFGCGDGKLYKGKAEHLRHALEDCSAVPIDCSRCHKASTRAAWAAHECVRGLIELVDPREGSSIKKALNEM